MRNVTQPPDDSHAPDQEATPLRAHLYHAKEANAAHARLRRYDHATLMAAYSEVQSRSEDESAFLTEVLDTSMRLAFADAAALLYHLAQVSRLGATP